MGAALIDGIQEVVEDGGIPARAAACMKHFIAYSDPINGHDRRYGYEMLLYGGW